MKKTLVFVLSVLFVLSCFSCHAEDLTSMTLEELTARRQELIDELTQVNTLRGSMIRQQAEEGAAPNDTLGKIIDLFPDEGFAKIIRDKCAKFSVEQPVTRAELEKITIVQAGTATIHDLTGIGYLKNLRLLELDYAYDGPFPEEIRSCLALDTLSISENPNITAIPDWIGELVNLQVLDLFQNDIASLPDSICNLSELEELDLNGNENLIALPANIGNLSKLKRLYISYTAISELPDSIWNLELTTLSMSGTSIR